jgi:heme/copper-type cytochrome/quinol oxidase subunit 2
MEYKTMIFMLNMLLKSQKAFAAPLLDGSKAATGPDDVFRFVNNVKGVAIAIVGVIIFGMIIYGGVLYISSAGNEEKIQKAKQTLTAAIFGLIIVILAYAIISFVASTLGEGIS